MPQLAPPLEGPLTLLHTAAARQGSQLYGLPARQGFYQQTKAQIFALKAGAVANLALLRIAETNKRPISPRKDKENHQAGG